MTIQNFNWRYFGVKAVCFLQDVWAELANVMYDLILCMIIIFGARPATPTIKLLTAFCNEDDVTARVNQFYTFGRVQSIYTLQEWLSRDYGQSPEQLHLVFLRGWDVYAAKIDLNTDMELLTDKTTGGDICLKNMPGRRLYHLGAIAD